MWIIYMKIKYTSFFNFPDLGSSPNKRSFRGPGGVGRDLDSDGAAKISARTGLCCLPLSPVVLIFKGSAELSMKLQLFCTFWICSVPTGNNVPLSLSLSLSLSLWIFKICYCYCLC